MRILVNTKEIIKYTKENIICIMQNTIDLFNSGSSSPRTAFLKSRRVDWHPYWPICMNMNLHAHAIFAQIAYTCNCVCIFWRNAILPIWVTFNSSGLQECSPRRWRPPFVFFQTSFVFIKTAGHSLLLLRLFWICFWCLIMS